MKHPYLLLILCSFSLLACAQPSRNKAKTAQEQTALQPVKDAPLVLGATRTDRYLPALEGKRVGLLINHTSLLPQEGEYVHLLDFLLSKGVNVTTIFTPEHGFRGTADAGEKVNSGTDAQTGLPIVSLYGSNKKPTAEQLKNIDVLLFDIQDVGARFYTYISSMHYAMEASAENDKKFIVLDRPNPHGHYVDGPVLEPAFRSFVGMHPIPVIHGLTVGELAQMINEEGWLAGGKKVALEVVPMDNYTHSTPYTLPVKPSPNLPNQQAIMLYPSLCFFEGTPVSVGRGTSFPFQVAGYPAERFGSFTFTPVSTPGAKSPKHENQTCYGIDLREAAAPNQLELAYLIDFYKTYEPKDDFFIPFFNLLAGTDELKKQIIAGATEEEIRESWAPELEDYKLLRKKYALYPLE
ncbi:exo-beta-N-acetylmuramidase NamZ family protein [Nafulsella turpanensis]|uniref:exo-beta-N-acetylmuramidase NamZ family protein n=1 Tax=Nafulsella turpanensis TaxID=1265690 RepID=UPI00058CD13D|nr:DUF1343 domain-containing protein [Nafulsella turpanensis]